MEVTPCIWGSFPLADCTHSPIACHYAAATAGEEASYTPCDYDTPVRMRFLLNDTGAILNDLRHGDFRMKKALEQVLDFFCGQIIFQKDGMIPYSTV